MVTLRARVFPSSDPSSRSALFERTIRFVNVPSVRVYLVGVNYTGPGMSGGIPTQSDMTTTLNLTERLYPTGELLTTGYQVLDFDSNMNANIASGCSDGFNSLLDALQDLRGNSSDIYYAELPSGVNTGSVGGCARGGVASSMNAAPRVAAHEIAHAFGLPHTPCSMTACPTQPAGADADYPQYGSFGRGSIGEFGYDPLSDTVFDPATTFDFMTYATPQWMSPYNYARLMEAGGGPADEGSSTPATRFMLPIVAFPELTPQPVGDFNPFPIEHLDLRLTIHRDRQVERDHSFHFPTIHGGCCGHHTEYIAEILDKEERGLICVPLTCSCNLCQPNCYPVIIRDRIPMPPGAALLRVWEGRDMMIYEENIPAPLELSWAEQYRTEDGIGLEWEPQRSFKNENLCYLVQFEDRPSVWRGVAPRSREPKIIIPWRFFQHRNRLNVRVLASSGIATGSIDDLITLEIPGETASRISQVDQPPVVVSPYGVLEAGADIGTYLRAVSHGGTQLRWYDENGVELSGSATLDLRDLPDGQHFIQAVAVGGEALQATHLLLVRKAGKHTTFMREFTPKQSDEPHIHPHPTPGENQENRED